MSRNVKSRMQKAVYLLLEGHSSKEVARHLNARPETLSRWKKHPYFIKEYERIRAEMCEDMRVTLWRLATNVFQDIATDGRGDQMRFERALRFFKAIKIEQIFNPHAPLIASIGPANVTETVSDDSKTPKKPILERIGEIADELLEVEKSRG